MKSIFIFLLLTKCFLVMGQPYPHGLILPTPENRIGGDHTILFPFTGINVYGANKKEIVGRLSLEQFNGFTLINRDLILEKVDFKYLEEVGYETLCLKYYDHREGFVKILGETNNLWLKTEDLTRIGMRVVDWKEFLIEYTGKLLGFYALEGGLNLRTGPSTSHKKVVTMYDDLFEIRLTGVCEGLWCEVEVTHYKEHPCAANLPRDEIVINTLKGWAKVLDDSTLPNLTYYSRGC